MNRQELKEALTDLNQQEPEFFRELVAGIVTQGLTLSCDHYGREYDTSPTYLLEWDCNSFSRA